MADFNTAYKQFQDPNQYLAQALMDMGNKEAQSPAEALLRGMTSGYGMATMYKYNKEMRDKEKKAGEQRALAAELMGRPTETKMQDGQSITWESPIKSAGNVLAANEDTAPEGFKLMVDDAQTRQKQEFDTKAAALKAQGDLERALMLQQMKARDSMNLAAFNNNAAMNRGVSLARLNAQLNGKAGANPPANGQQLTMAQVTQNMSPQERKQVFDTFNAEQMGAMKKSGDMLNQMEVLLQRGNVNTGIFAPMKTAYNRATNQNPKAQGDTAAYDNMQKALAQQIARAMLGSQSEKELNFAIQQAGSPYSTKEERLSAVRKMRELMESVKTGKRNTLQAFDPRLTQFFDTATGGAAHPAPSAATADPLGIR